MQTYAIICDLSGQNWIIVKKRDLNNYWQGRLQGSPILVNQAGQYALCGGRMESSDESLASGALREVAEETGFVFSGIDIAASFTKNYAQGSRATNFAATIIIFNSDAEILQELATQMSSNIAANSADGKTPASGMVVDWELQDIQITPTPQNFLGIRIPVNDPIVQSEINDRLQNPNDYSQDVEWYQMIAADITNDQANFLANDGSTDTFATYMASAPANTAASASASTADDAVSPSTSDEEETDAPADHADDTATQSASDAAPTTSTTTNG